MTEQDRPQLPADLQQLLGVETRPAPAPAEQPAIVLTRGKKALVSAVSGFVTIIAGIGFAGSYNAVTKLATAKGFGWFAWAFPAGIDAGIGGFLALDLLLTWLRMPYPLLRPAAWLLTAATIAFNSSAAWGDWVAVGMHATIPLLFVVAIEAARHAVGRIANIEGDRHIESPPMIRWFIAPWPTFRIWRRMRLWQLATYNDVVKIEQDARVFRVKLRRRYGKKWRDGAKDHELLALTLAHYGTPIHITLAEHESELQQARETAAALSPETPDHSHHEAHETPGESESASPSRRTRRRESKKKPQRNGRESGRESAATKVSALGEIEREIEALIALMHQREGADGVSQKDAEQITGKSPATAARRLSTARTRFRKSA